MKISVKISSFSFEFVIYVTVAAAHLNIHYEEYNEMCNCATATVTQSTNSIV